MTDLCRLIFWTLVDLMRARATLEAEIWVLRQQIDIGRAADLVRCLFYRLARCQCTLTIFASSRRVFKHAAARRIAANLVEFLEADAMPVGASVAGATFATASVTGRTLRAESVADRNRPHSSNNKSHEQ